VLAMTMRFCRSEPSVQSASTQVLKPLLQTPRAACVRIAMGHSVSAVGDESSQSRYRSERIRLRPGENWVGALVMKYLASLGRLRGRDINRHRSQPEPP
jgi:hypothetical protein